jgi:hypothetical protein
MDIHRDGNLIEALVWFAAAAAMLVKSRSETRPARNALLLLATATVGFGVSDLVEMRTSAWWKPWWLFVWKAACVLAMLALFTRYFRLVKRRP